MRYAHAMVQRRATYEDVLAVPERFVAEIINGELRVHSRPAPKHSNAATGVGARLHRVFHDGDGGPGGFWVLFEPELHLATEDIIVPDIAAWRVERMPELPETAYFTVVPDWICEVLSPSTAAEDRADKMPIYAAVGVPFAWLIDPIVRTVEAYELDRGRWVLNKTFRDNDVVQAAPFAEYSLDLATLWAPPQRK
jgi:Uma2 family endonuclease